MCKSLLLSACLLLLLPGAQAQKDLTQSNFILVHNQDIETLQTKHQGSYVMLPQGIPDPESDDPLCLKGKRLITGGIGTIILGAIMSGTSIYMMGLADKDDFFYELDVAPAYVLGSIGLLGIAAGVPILVKGVKLKKANCGKQDIEVLNLKVSKQGLGLSYNF